ncbi:MAG: type I secretion system permease/ATPase [Hyphomonadaceae bacterium]|nr:type I secretion system permease/ATPase [Hyphomonadaceae bacterium]
MAIESTASDTGPAPRGPRAMLGVLRRWFAGAEEGGAGRTVATAALQRGPVKGAFSEARRYVVLAAVFSAAVNILYLAPSLYMLQVYDRVLVSGGLLTLAFLSAIALIALVVMALLDALRSRVMARFAMRLDSALVEPVMRANFAARGRAADGRDFSGVRDLDTLRQGISSPGAIALLDVPWTPFFILICFVVHPAVGILATAGAFAIFAAAWLNERESRSGVREITQTAPLFYGGLEADLRVSETARAMGMEPALVGRRLREREGLVALQTRTAFVAAHFGSAIKFLRMVLQSATLGLGAYLAVQQEISAGAIIAVTILTSRAFAPIEQVVSGWKPTQQAWLAYRSLEKALESFAPASQRTTLPRPTGRVDLDKIFVRHPGAERPAVAGATIAFAAGEIIGIIGPSGAGKSTLARVIANACEPTAGVVRLDGARYQDWSPEQLAAAMGYLPQAVDLMPGTVAENIRRFLPVTRETAGVMSERVIAAAVSAGVHDLILALPKAYDTPVGAGGKGLSFGQAQRIGLARALFGDPQVLVLDEPNAHVDEDGEQALINAIKGAKSRGASVFVVAHRARLINEADTLVVMREGLVLEVGPREKVIARMQAVTGAPASSSVTMIRPRARPQDQGGPDQAGPV